MGRNYAILTAVLAFSGMTEPLVIQDIVPLFTSWISILFDTGLSHSFFSLTLILSLGFMIVFLDVDLYVSNPVGGVIFLNQVCRGCLLSIADRQLSIDLIIMPNLEFDIIIAMDFLSFYHMSTDCVKRQVILLTTEGDCL